MGDKISASEQKSVFLDIKEWLYKVLDPSIQISVADMSRTECLAIVPAKGIRRHKLYACGGYEVYLPFSIYYRCIADDDKTTTDVLDLLDGIGIKLEKNGTDDVPALTLSGSREVLESYQDMTAIKYKQSGTACDFTASYILIYSREE